MGVGVDGGTKEEVFQETYPPPAGPSTGFLLSSSSSSPTPCWHVPPGHALAPYFCRHIAHPPIPAGGYVCEHLSVAKDPLLVLFSSSTRSTYARITTATPQPTPHPPKSPHSQQRQGQNAHKTTPPPALELPRPQAPTTTHGHQLANARRTQPPTHPRVHSSTQLPYQSTYVSIHPSTDPPTMRRLLDAVRKRVEQQGVPPNMAEPDDPEQWQALHHATAAGRLKVV